MINVHKFSCLFDISICMPYVRFKHSIFKLIVLRINLLIFHYSYPGIKTTYPDTLARSLLLSSLLYTSNLPAQTVSSLFKLYLKFLSWIRWFLSNHSLFPKSQMSAPSHYFLKSNKSDLLKM